VFPDESVNATVNGADEPNKDKDNVPLLLLQVESVVLTDTIENEFGVTKEVA
jgi:hypothetical protein